MAKPKGYPLPWCEELDVPYWSLNFQRCLLNNEWAKWQAKRPMSEIIPRLRLDLNLDS